MLDRLALWVAAVGVLILLFFGSLDINVGGDHDHGLPQIGAHL